MNTIFARPICARKYWSSIFLAWMILSVGCEGGPTPRLPEYWHPSEVKEEGIEKNQGNPHVGRVGFVVMSDGTAPGAAPPLSPSMLDILASTAFSKIKEGCRPPNFQQLSSRIQNAGDNTQTLKDVATTSEVDHLMVLIFSSMESTEPAVFGESRMMTQMPGTSTHSTALAEMAVIERATGTVLTYRKAEGDETLDRLTAPLGDDALPLEKALDVLRANATNQAWENVEDKFIEECQTLYPKP